MWSRKKRRQSINTILTYGRPHWSWLVKGGLATIGVVFFRLAMPWPLRWVVEVVFPRGSEEGGLMVDYLPAWGEPVVWLAGIYVLLAFGLGICELIQRIDIMRFAAHTVHDMRAAAVKGAKALAPEERASSGDLIARIIGDSARIKAGLSGIMLHGLQNGLLFFAVCAVMFYISFLFGLIFFIAGLVALYIGLSASSPVARTASRQRRKEGDYAAAIQEGLDSGELDLQMEEINLSSARKEVRTTRLIARSSLLVHVVLAAAVGLALSYGSYGVEAGFISPGELFLFIAYALTVHRRMVQVGRQAARTGKVMACADRIGVVIQHGGAANVAVKEASQSVELTSGLRLDQVKLASGRGRIGKARLGQTAFSIIPGSRVAVLGKIGSGKTSLLRLLAGVESPTKGSIFWDDEEVSGDEAALSARVAYLPQDPVFPPTQIWKVLGLSAPGQLKAEEEETLSRIEALKLVRSFPEGLETKVGSSALSRNEARLLRLAGLLFGDRARVWVLDNPTQGLSRKKAQKCLKEITRRATGRTVVVAVSESAGLENFDRVLLIRRGKIRFDGSPAELEEFRKAQA